ncbi:hypothetical protein P8452_25750 [Trifolium repens]|nr:hypothetical protein P8452_25750 [Trifolium repens]
MEKDSEKPYKETEKKISDEDDDDNDDAKMMMKKQEAKSTHKCNICGKSFNNGKALGGHRRSHFLKKKPNHDHRHQSPELKTPSKSTRVSCFNDDEDIRICYICNKKFPTKNALYGHMRSHPGRVCKGVSPPSNYHIQNSSSSNNSNKKEDQDNDVDDDDDGNFSLPRWKKRDKRGRKCIGSVEAAKNLLHLRHNCEVSGLNSKRSDFPLPIKKRDFFVGGSSSNGNGKKEFVVNKIKFVFSGSLKIENKSDWNGDDDDDDHDDQDESDNISNKKLKTSEGLCESRVDEKPSNHSEEQKTFNFDLNEPYVMED